MTRKTFYNCIATIASISGVIIVVDSKVKVQPLETK